MPRKKTETTAPVAEATKRAPNTAKKTTRSRETKTKETKKTTTKTKKPETKREKVEVVEAELVQESQPKRKGYGKNNNLVSNSERTPEELREMTRKGGIASGEARRKKKNLREFGQAFLMQDVSPVFGELMQRHMVDDEDMTNLAALFVRIFNKAMSTGDLNAARQVVEWAGMAPLQEMRENEAMAKMAQVMQLASGTDDENAKIDDDVVFYIPENGRKIITDDDLVTVSEQPVDPVQQFWERRQNRLMARLDAEEDGENNKSGGGGHGNTRIPFGLCQREGIQIKDGWTPEDAWNALEGKGYSAGDVYKELKETGKVATKKVPETPKMSLKEANKEIKGFQEKRKKLADSRFRLNRSERDLDIAEIYLRAAGKAAERAYVGGTGDSYEHAKEAFEEAKKRRNDARDKVERLKKEIADIEDSEERKRYIEAVKTKWPSFEDCKTNKELKERFDVEDYFSNDKSSFGRLPTEDAVALAKDVETFFEKNPKMKGKLGYLEVKGMYYGGLSYDDHVELNFGEFSGRGKIAKTRSFIHSEHIADYATQTLFHEYTHQMDWYISKKLGMKNMEFSKSVYNDVVERLKKSGSPLVTGMEEKIPSKITGEKRKEFLDGLIKERVKRSVSVYAYKGGKGVHKDDIEFFAEAFSTFQTSENPDEVSKLVGQIVKERMDKLED